MCVLEVKSIAREPDPVHARGAICRICAVLSPVAPQMLWLPSRIETSTSLILAMAALTPVSILTFITLRSEQDPPSGGRQSDAKIPRLMSVPYFTLFETAIGRCGIAWLNAVWSAFSFPSGAKPRRGSACAGRFPQAREVYPPAEVQLALDGIVALLRGERSDLCRGERSTWKACRRFIAAFTRSRAPFHPGATLSYGEIAKQLGSLGSARAVGQALGRNPFAIVVPCHRVLAADGGWAGSPRMEASRPSSACSRSRVRVRTGSSRCSRVTAFSVSIRMPRSSICAPPTRRSRGSSMRSGLFACDSTGRRASSCALAEAIVYQQLNGRAAATIFARLCALFPGGHAGPNAEQILRASDARLRSAGLSRSKMLSLRDLARKAVDGKVPTLAEVHRMDDEAIIERLTEVRGIGRWTVEMLLMFRLGRPDVLPVDDYGVRKGFTIAFRKRKPPHPKDLQKYGARWRPYRTVASWYLWRATDLGKDLRPKT